jgi:hypothetical protein
MLLRTNEKEVAWPGSKVRHVIELNKKIECP